jgi:hypothetical protein
VMTAVPQTKSNRSKYAYRKMCMAQIEHSGA